MRVKIFSNSSKRTFREYSAYVMSKADCSILLQSYRIAAYSTEAIALSFALEQKASPNILCPQIHMVLQFTTKEAAKTDKNKKRSIIKEFLRRMGWNGCQYIAVIHKDVPGNPHCHIVLNAINHIGQHVSDSFSIKKARSIIRKMTRELFGPTITSDTRMKERIKKMVDHASRESLSLRDLRKNLEMEMIETRLLENGALEFNEVGSDKRFSYPQFTARKISLSIHGDLKKESERRKKVNFVKSLN